MHFRIMPYSNQETILFCYETFTVLLNQSVYGEEFFNELAKRCLTWSDTVAQRASKSSFLIFEIFLDVRCEVLLHERLAVSRFIQGSEKFFGACHCWEVIWTRCLIQKVIKFGEVCSNRLRQFLYCDNTTCLCPWPIDLRGAAALLFAK